MLKQKAENLSKINMRFRQTANHILDETSVGQRPPVDDWELTFRTPIETKTSSNSTTRASSNSTTTARASAAYSLPIVDNFSNGTSDSKTDGNEIARSETYIQNPNYVSPDQANNSADKAENDYIEANLKATEADVRAKETLERLKIAKDSLIKQQQLVSEEITALTIKSRASGYILWSVLEGVFVKKGHILGSIKL